ncbi:MAG TPA: glycosyltransferase, partial [Bryobacteraceae bacterium]|nr:glycosyltransferase [Bryobacteraceae bacterium]
MYLAAFRGAFWRLRERVGAGSGTGAGGSVTAVIPARDEESSIGRTVASLRRQRFDGALRIVVADDESADRTGESARAAGADAVIRVAPRPAGWKGKLWAVSEGLR